MRIAADRLSIGLLHTGPMVPAQPPQNGAPRSASKGAVQLIEGPIGQDSIADEDLSSPGWTRTNNPPVNSRMLCQLSYRGLAAPSVAGR